jgi:protein arginine kinase
MSGSAAAVAGRFRLYGSMPAWFNSNGPEGDVVVSTRIRLARNIAGYKFPQRASSKDKQKIFIEASGALCNAIKNFDLEVVNFGRINKLEQHFLIEERRLSMDMLKAEGERGAVCDVSGRLSVMINEEDHLRIQGMDSGFRDFDLWETVDKVDNAIGKSLKYAYSDRLGFLTSCPTNSGTGLRISYLMHLPGLVLTKAIDPVLHGASQMGIATRGFFGEHSDVVGNFFQLSNQATMGSSEKEFIESTGKAIREIIGHERGARGRLLKDAPLELSDKICRAHGILCNARMLSLPEFLNLMSALRIGADCGIYKEHTVDDINKMIMVCMPAHLQVYISDKYEKFPELDVARADVVRGMFAAAKQVLEDRRDIVDIVKKDALKKDPAKKDSVKSSKKVVYDNAKKNVVKKGVVKKSIVKKGVIKKKGVTKKKTKSSKNN